MAAKVSCEYVHASAAFQEQELSFLRQFLDNKERWKRQVRQGFPGKVTSILHR
jgi:hypothetical protein